MLKLEFGCGEKPTPGFTGVDVRKLDGVKYVCRSWEITNHVDPGSVAQVYSRHFFEHLTFIEARWTLDAWHQILKQDGILTIIVPDMEFHIKQWSSPTRDSKGNPNGLTDEEWAIRGFWGQQRETDKGETWDLHKSGYDYRLLKKKLEGHKFRKIARQPDAPKNLTVKAIK